MEYQNQYVKKWYHIIIERITFYSLGVRGRLLVCMLNKKLVSIQRIFLLQMVKG